MDTPNDPIVSRLQRLAATPIAPEVESRHLTALAVTTPSRPSRVRLGIAGGLMAGTLLAGSGLASAGMLPASAQDVAHEALAKVGVAVPAGKAAKANRVDETVPNAREAGESPVEDVAGTGTERFLGDADTPCTLPDGSAFTGNHGQYVSAHPDDPATTDVNERQVAAQSDCGKPLSSVDGAGDVEGRPAHAGKPAGAGKPSDAGKPASPGKSAEHKPATAGKRATPAKPAGAGKPADAGSQGKRP